MKNKLPYTHLIYVRKYSILDNDYKLCAYGVNTKDIHHTIGEIVYRTLEDIKRIDYVDCTQSSLDYLKEQDIKIYDFYNKYELEQTPTEEEIKKEWEALGYELIRHERREISFKTKDKIFFNIYNYGTVRYKKYWKTLAIEITLQEHQLLTKTFKMLGW